MNRYFILKTGWDVLDLSRAYGLGTLLYTLSSQSRDIVLSDKNYWYEINAPSDISLDVETIAGYLDDNLDWNKVLITTKRGAQSAIKKKIRDFLSDKSKVMGILKKYSAFEVSQIPFTTRSSETLYGSMEPRSFKGFREPVRLKTSYSEGGTPKVSFQDWLLSIVGHINLTVWVYRADFSELLSVMPIPTNDGVEFGDLYAQIRDDIKRNIRRMHLAGRYPTLAYVGTRLTKSELGKMELAYSSAYQSLLYGSMMATGKGISQQWKPTISGIFPLDFIHFIAMCSRGIEILDMWEDVFKKTNRKGFEDLAVALADFIAVPTSVYFAKYLNLHARQFIGKKSGLHLYDSDVMREMVRYV